MSSLTLKGKPLDQAPLASSSSAPSLAAAAAASNAPSTGTLDITYNIFSLNHESYICLNVQPQICKNSKRNLD